MNCRNGFFLLFISLFLIRCGEVETGEERTPAPETGDTAGSVDTLGLAQPYMDEDGWEDDDAFRLQAIEPRDTDSLALSRPDTAHRLPPRPEIPGSLTEKERRKPAAIDSALFYEVPYDVRIGHYFQFMDSVVAYGESRRNFSLNEYYIARYNPWLIDTLAATDYYYLQERRDTFVYDNRRLVVLHRGDSLRIPGRAAVDSLHRRMMATLIEVNIPEFKLRIRELGGVVHTFEVRVGKDSTQYLEMADREVDLRTRTGGGEIVRVNRDPVFIHPDNGERYSETRRDDGRTTRMPLIPWLEPSINGLRWGQLIHPVANISTLGQAFSHGCIGLREAAAWRVYYHAPIGTKVAVRHDPVIVNDFGQRIVLEEVYPELDTARKDSIDVATQYQAPIQ